MIRKLVIASGALAMSAALATSPAQAQSIEEIHEAYEAGKPSPGGLSPSTRGEYAMCMGAWGVMGALAIAEPELSAAIHPDLNESETNAHFAHWWVRAEAAYGAERVERLVEDIQKAADEVTEYLSRQELLPPMSMLGTCYVAAEARENGGGRASVRSLFESRNSIVPSLDELRAAMN